MSKFTIYPAIDIRDGKCVRLYQGDYNQETIYGNSPLAIAEDWVNQGAEYLHLVDLDGAKAGRSINKGIISVIAKTVSVPVQVGGGIRTLEDIKEYFNLGIQRVILGTVLLEDLELAQEALNKYGDRIAVGIDAKEGKVAVRGWLEESDVSATVLSIKLKAMGAQTFIYTDISKDGTLTGPSFDKTQELAQATGGQVIASGGVSSIEDLVEMRKLRALGVTGAIVGKALYTGKIQLKEALTQLGGD